MNHQKPTIKIENEEFQYILSEDSLIATGDDPELSNTYTNVVYAGDSHTVLLQGDQYYIQTGDGETFLLENEQESLDHLVINNDEQSEDDTIGYLESTDSDSIVYQVGGKRLKLDNGQLLAVADGETVGTSSEQLNILNAVTNSDSSIQYAVIKDGQLHLQIADTDTVEILNNPDDQLTENADSNPEYQIYSESDDTEPFGTSLELSKITGRNVLTGKTVNLSDYMERFTINKEQSAPKNNTFVNHKFNIGRVSTGKFLVGKILNIKPAKKPVNKKPNIEYTSAVTSTDIQSEDSTADEDVIAGEITITNNVIDVSQSTVEIQELLVDGQGNILHVTKEANLENGANEEQSNFLSRILNGLVKVEKMKKKLLGRKLQIKLIEKKMDAKQALIEKVVTNVTGYLAVECKDDPDDNTKEEENTFLFADGTENLETLERESTSISVTAITDSDGQKSTTIVFPNKIEPFMCTICERGFRSQPTLNRHVAQSHGKTALTCSMCHLSFANFELITKHRKELHHYFNCTLCSRKFNSEATLKRHTATHNRNTLECNICNVTFNNVSNLCKHLIVESETFQCNVCNKTFARASDYNYHKKIHYPMRTFTCEICSRAFSRHSNLLRHQEIHQGQGNVHKCTICGCSYKFMSSLTRHMVQNHVKKS